MPDVQKTASFLAKVPLFQGLKKGQLERLAMQFVAREHPAGEEIVTQGKGGVGLFIITSGAAEAILMNPDGSTVVVNEFGPTDYFGELSLLDDGPRTASVVTTEPTECLTLMGWHFRSELKRDADMAVSILEEVVKRFRRALQRL